MASDQPDFVFVHLSDVHFRSGQTGDLHDGTANLRNEVELDLRNAGTLVPRIDALIVSGDIAFAGKAEEYTIAAAWLRSLGEQVGCTHDQILVTPGNHDVDRDLLPAGSQTLAFHEDVQRCSSMEDRDARLAACLRDPERGRALLKPLAEYNAFARIYGCDVSCDRPFWERHFPLGDGSELCIRGLSTTLVSGPRDNVMPQNLAYSEGQRTFLRRPGLRRMLVGHHPPSWTSDGDSAAQAFSKRNVVQLFGHRHSQWIASDDDSVRIIAGAVHPDPREPGWEPRFNIVTLTLRSPTSMSIRIFPRVWSKEELMFSPDHLANGAIDRERTVQIDKFERSAQVQVPRTTHAGLVKRDALAVRLLKLGNATMSQIAIDLGLFIAADKPVAPMRLIVAAVTAGKLDDLETRLDTAESAALGLPDSER